MDDILSKFMTFVNTLKCSENHLVKSMYNMCLMDQRSILSMNSNFIKMHCTNNILSYSQLHCTESVINLTNTIFNFNEQENFTNFNIDDCIFMRNWFSTCDNI